MSPGLTLVSDLVMGGIMGAEFYSNSPIKWNGLRGEGEDVIFVIV